MLFADLYGVLVDDAYIDLWGERGFFKRYDNKDNIPIAACYTTVTAVLPHTDGFGFEIHIMGVDALCS